MEQLLITYIIFWILSILIGRLLFPWMFRTNKIVENQDKQIKDTWYQLEKVIKLLENKNKE